LARHGETIWNLEGRRQGRGDSSLTASGIAQAEMLGQWLREEVAENDTIQIVSSPLGRAMNTALIVAKCLCIDKSGIRIEPLLAELDTGSWEGLTNEQIDEMFPRERKRRNRNRWEYLIPGGESYETVYNRSIAWLAGMPEDSIVIAVTHEMISQTIRGAYCGLSPNDTLQLEHPHRVIYRLNGGAAEEIIFA
jgi:probable phosphoglycerate mutase